MNKTAQSIMINSFFFKNGTKIFSKNGRKIRIFSLGRKSNSRVKKECNFFLTSQVDWGFNKLYKRGTVSSVIIQRNFLDIIFHNLQDRTSGSVERRGYKQVVHHSFNHELITRGKQHPYQTHITAFSRNGLFLDTFQSTFSRENVSYAPSMTAFKA